jgi:hypothetical protein
MNGIPAGQSRRRVLTAGLGLAAGSVAFGTMERPAAAAANADRLPWKADLGDGRYQNPVLNADWSDPDAVRVGGHFYLTASTFNRIPACRSCARATWSTGRSSGMP